MYECKEHKFALYLSYHHYVLDGAETCSCIGHDAKKKKNLRWGKSRGKQQPVAPEIATHYFLFILINLSGLIQAPCGLSWCVWRLARQPLWPALFFPPFFFWLSIAHLSSLIDKKVRCLVDQLSEFGMHSKPTISWQFMVAIFSPGGPILGVNMIQKHLIQFTSVWDSRFSRSVRADWAGLITPALV